jgi:hypothetical protein
VGKITCEIYRLIFFPPHQHVTAVVIGSDTKKKFTCLTHQNINEENTHDKIIRANNTTENISKCNNHV